MYFIRSSLIRGGKGMRRRLELLFIVIVCIVCFFILDSKSSIAVKKVVKPQYKATIEKSAPPKKLDRESQVYQKATQELDKQMYQFYRIVERIARANRLDDYSWRIVINRDGKYDFNAATSDCNLIVLESGIADTFSGDISALAFVISHEMAHQMQEHIAEKSSKYSQITQDINKLEKKMNEVESFAKQAEDQVEYNNRAMMSESTGFIGLITLSSQNKKIKKQLEQNTAELTQVKNQLDQQVKDYITTLHDNEFEADSVGLNYMVKAGFDPIGAIRTFKFLKRLPSTIDTSKTSKLEKVQQMIGTSESLEASTHPPLEGRINKLESLLQSINLESMKQEGQTNFDFSDPLTYEESADSFSLKINSKFGSSENVNQPFEQMFGK